MPKGVIEKITQIRENDAMIKQNKEVEDSVRLY